MKSSAAALRAVGERVHFTVQAIAASTAPSNSGDALMHVSLRSTLTVMALAAVLAPAAAKAQPTTFSSFDAFAAAVGTRGVDTFDDLTAGEFVEGPLARQAGTFGYSVAANGSGSSFFFPLDNPVDATDIWLSTEDALASITFSGFGNDVRAIGGNFFATDFFNGAFSAADLIFIAEDVNSTMVERTLSPQSTDAFFGVLFDNPLRSLRLVVVNDPDPSAEAFFATANNLVLAQGPASVPVPEPSTLLLVAVPLVLLLVRRRRFGA